MSPFSRRYTFLHLQFSPLAFWHKLNLIIHHYFTYVNAFTLVHLFVFEFASIYLSLVRSHWRKAQECQKIMCFNLC